MSLESNQNAASPADSNQNSAVCRVCLSSGDGVELHSLFEGDSRVKEMFDIISGNCINLHGEDAMICSSCVKVFTVIQSFKLQMLKVDTQYFQPQRELKKKQQEETIRKSLSLLEKNLNETSITAPSVAEDSDNTSIVQDDHQCTICLKYYCTKYVLRHHMENVHKKHQISVSYVSCTTCSAKFADKGSLRKHMDIHIKTIHLQTEFKCYRCGKKFDEKIVLKEHLKAHKTRDNLSPKNDRNSSPKIREKISKKLKIFKCKKCNNCFNCKSSLKFHIIQSHKKLKMENFLNFQDASCVICKKSFTSSFHLSVHTKAKHLKTRDFKCEMCDRSFLLKLNLQSHMRTHQ